jgi:c-di-AMP phosphodiesterase-like protein
MKTTDKTFDAVKFMRQQRDKLSEKLAKMTKDEILEYFKKRNIQSTIKPGA